MKEKTEAAYRCPKCGSTELEVRDCRVIGHMPLTDDGFILAGDTTDEEAICKQCAHKGPLSIFMKE